MSPSQKLGYLLVVVIVIVAVSSVTKHHETPAPTPAVCVTVAPMRTAVQK